MKPLSPHALAELRNLARAPEPCCGINPGVRNKLTTEGLAEYVQLASPFKVHRGRTTNHLQITAAGRLRLAAAHGETQ